MMLREFLSAYKKDNDDRLGLNPIQRQKIAVDIDTTNLMRVRIFLVLTLFFEILLIIFNDIPAIGASEPNQLWLAQAYLILHAIIGLTALVGVVVFSLLLKKGLDQKHNNSYWAPIPALIILVCLSIITGLDQIKTGQISAFVINLLVCGVFLLVPLRISSFLFTIPFGVFIAAIMIYQPDAAIQSSHFINGGIFWVAVLVVSKFMYDNRVSHLIKNFKLEEANQKLEAANQQLSTLSTHDPLTNLSNRRYFEARIEHELALIKRFNQNAWLILVDIDHFKNINDRFGHAGGDRVLQEVAAFLQSNIRDVDLACRWGGEEFLLLVTRTELDGITQVANRLCTMLAQLPFDADGKIIAVTASFGVAMLTNRGTEEDAFQVCYRLADQALYRAKQNGRNQVVIIEPL